MHSPGKFSGRETILRLTIEPLQIFRISMDLQRHLKAMTASEKRRREVKEDTNFPYLFVWIVNTYTAWLTIMRSVLKLA